MLVLSRKLGQCLIIGENIVVTVVAARGSQVRLGIEVPAEVIVRRDELCPAVAAKMPSLKKKLPRIPRCGANRAS